MSSIERSERGLLIREGARAFLLPVRTIVETCRPLPVAATPGMPTCALGVSILRGRPLPGVDLARGRGEPERAAGRFVTLRLAERRAVLAVGDVVGLLDGEPLGSADLPPLLADAGSEIVARLAVLDRELVQGLEAGRLVPDAVWEALASSRTDGS